MKCRETIDLTDQIFELLHDAREGFGIRVFGDRKIDGVQDHGGLSGQF